MIRSIPLPLLLLIASLAAPGLLPCAAHAQASSAQAPSAVEGAADEQPDEVMLSAAYPNPFNPVTTFSLTVSRAQEVRVEVYNMLGQPVRLLFEGHMEAGETRTLTFDGGDLPTGIYLYRAHGTSFVATRQVTLLK